MRTLALVFLALAVLLTAGLIPMTYSIAAHNGRDGNPAGFGILVLCLLRAAVLITALLLINSRAIHALFVIAGVVVLETACGAMLFLSIDKQVSLPWPHIFGILATALPICIIASGFFSNRLLFTGAVGIAAAFGISGVAAYDSLTVEWRNARQTEQQTLEQTSARRAAELAKLPAGAKIEELLQFTGPDESGEVRQNALARIDTAQLLPMLDGPNSADALYALQERVATLPADVQEHCWTAAGRLAREMSARIAQGQVPTQAELRKVYAPAKMLGGIPGSIRARHQSDLTAVRDMIRAAEAKGVIYEGTAWLDSYLAEAAR
ncbi:MAG: hypothetical protein HYX27_27720 [Acidobacteria bacterium]|nr:hypothetical protein [Acidobacteriota bacterium]